MFGIVPKLSISNASRYFNKFFSTFAEHYIFIEAVHFYILLWDTITDVWLAFNKGFSTQLNFISISSSLHFGTISCDR